MKTRLLIIEDNYYRFFTMKQLLEFKLNLKVQIDIAENRDAVFEKAAGYKAGNIILQNGGGIMEFLTLLKKKRVNRLNSEVTLLVSPELTWQHQAALSAARISKPAVPDRKEDVSGSGAEASSAGENYIFAA